MRPQTSTNTRTRPIEAPSGRTTLAAWKDELDEPRLEITCIITKPTTSSIIAALASTVPSRVAVNLLELRTVKVVPRLVEQSAAPAAKACNGVASDSGSSEKESAMGRTMPVAATSAERKRFAFKEEKETDRPPTYVRRVKIGTRHTVHVSWYLRRQSVSIRDSLALQSGSQHLLSTTLLLEFPMQYQ